MKSLKKSLFLVVSLLSLGVLISGCGYTTRSLISDKFKTIYIPPFVNKVDISNEVFTQNKYRIYRPYLETEVTKKVNNKFLFDGNLRPVKEGSADLVLKGDLVGFAKEPLRYTDNDEVEEYRLNVSVDIALWDTRENKMVWEEKGFTGSTTYFTSFSNSNPKKSDDQAVTDAVDDLARRIVERAVEQW